MSTIVACLLAAALTGCSAARVETNVQSGLGEVDADARDVEFWSRLYGNHLICNDDALHGLILFFYEKDDCQNYEARVALLKEKGLLDSDFNGAADQAFTRGRFAVALARGMKVEGGVFHTLFPMSQRYAIRHLEYENLFPLSSLNQTVSGTDFVGIVGRAEDFERIQQAEKAPKPTKDFDKRNPEHKR